MKTNAVTVYVRATAAGLEVDQITKEHFHISVWLKGVCNGPLFAHFSFFQCPSCLCFSFSAFSYFLLAIVLCSCSTLAPPGGDIETHTWWGRERY